MTHAPATDEAPAPASVFGPAAVTVVAGTSFLICQRNGDVVRGGVHGYFAGDTRLVDELQLLIGGETPRFITGAVDERTIESTASVGDPTRPQLLAQRCTRLDELLAIDLTLINLSSEPQRTTVDLVVHGDFADLFDVKRGVAPRAGFVGSGPERDRLVLAYASGRFRRTLRVSADRPAEVWRDALHLEVEIDARAHSTVRFELRPDVPSESEDHLTALSQRDRAAWLSAVPAFGSEVPGLDATWRQACADISALLLAQGRRTERPIVAAGSPWFMALFGRDSLITSRQVAALGTSLGLGTLQALAARIGREHVAETGEQPGKILHELRAGEEVLRPGGWGSVYYGSVDASPLFVSTLAAMWRWGAPPGEIADLLPAAEAAVGWVLTDGDPDGDGFVEYAGRRPDGVAGLANQAWKDSEDAMRHRDGSLAKGPIAAVEVQGYCVEAFRGLADLRAAFGTADPAPLRRRADELVAAIDEAFWMDDEQCFALALDGRKRQVGSVSSNPGHLLWAGAVRKERRAALCGRLMAEDMFTGLGLRTLSAGNPGYNPLSYHCGSVWPHDSALAAAGMLRGGGEEQGARLAAGLLTAAGGFGGRLPELFGGFDVAEMSTAVPYPSSCSPQAWAAGAAVLLTTCLLGLEPDVPAGVVRLDPRLPDDTTIELRGVPLGRERLDLRARGHELLHAEVTGQLRIEA
jgi:glycogen debranching enzyme